MKVLKNIAISESGFIFNPFTGDSYSVNPMGLEIISMLKEEKSEQEIIDKIVSEYSIDRNTVEKDFEEFKSLLNAYKLTES